MKSKWGIYKYPYNPKDKPIKIVNSKDKANALCVSWSCDFEYYIFRQIKIEEDISEFI